MAGKLHTGRSRNDQVATDLRLWVLQAIPQITTGIRTLQRTILSQAAHHTESVMPGFTHFQPAQPITAAHWLLSFAQMLERDHSQFHQLTNLTAVNPLGSGALAGRPAAGTGGAAGIGAGGGGAGGAVQCSVSSTITTYPN